jgi:hypothetical protein
MADLSFLGNEFITGDGQMIGLDKVVTSDTKIIVVLYSATW